MNMVASWYAVHFVQGAYKNHESFRIAFDRSAKPAFGYVDGLIED